MAARAAAGRVRRQRGEGLAMLSQTVERYRHVVFVDTLCGVHARNFAPRPAWSIPPAHGSLLAAAAAKAAPDPGDDPTAMRSAPRDLDPDQEHFVRWLFRKAGLDARHYFPETLRRRLDACLR